MAKMAGDGWNCRKIAEIVWKWLQWQEMNGNFWKWLVMGGMAKSI